MSLTIEASLGSEGITANGWKECPNANNVGAGCVLAGGGANGAGSRP